MTRIAVAAMLGLLGMSLVACGQFPGPETCTLDASISNTSGPGQTGSGRICRASPGGG